MEGLVSSNFERMAEALTLLQKEATIASQKLQAARLAFGQSSVLKFHNWDGGILSLA